MRTLVGVDVGGTNTKLALLSADGDVGTSSLPTMAAEGPAAFVERLASALEERLRGRTAPEAVGLAVAGLVDRGGRLLEAPNLGGFVGFDLAGELSARTGGLPVVVENDVNAAVVAESRRGVAAGHRDVVMLALGTGVGGGLLLGGRLYRGASGLAGEVGHTTLQVDGPECSCGQRGHVEAYLGTRGIVVHAGSRLGNVSDAEKEPLLRWARREGALTPRAIAGAAEEGDPLAISILGEVGHLLGLVCADLVNVFDPEVVVVGGGVAGAGDLVLDPARRVLKERALGAGARRVQLLAAGLGTVSAAIGAALLAGDALDAGERPGA